MSWYNNDAGFSARKPRKYTPRFRMKVGTERLITFVDEPVVSFDGVELSTPVLYNEYSIQINGRWGNFFSQPFEKDADVLGELGYRASRVAAMTVIDHNEWTDRNGVTHRDELSLYVMKRSQPIWAQVERLVKKEGSLRGKTFLVSRMGEKSSSAGTLIERHDSNFPINDTHQPFNYLEILKPRSRQEIEELLGKDNDPFRQQSSQPQQQQQSSGWGQTQQAQTSWNQPQAQTSWNQPQNSWNDNRVIGTTSSSDDDPVPF